MPAALAFIWLSFSLFSGIAILGGLRNIWCYLFVPSMLNEKLLS